MIDQHFFFHLGPPKTATTWFFRAMKTHPSISAPWSDNIGFFDRHYDLGWEWYSDHFEINPEVKYLFDPSPSYFADPLAIDRLAAMLPTAKIIFCYRDPVERAFSHYWHLKKKRDISVKFDAILTRPDFFKVFAAPSYYGFHLNHILRKFPKENVHIIDFEEICSDPDSVLEKACGFLGIAGLPKGVGSAVVNKATNRVTRPEKWLRYAALALANRLPASCKINKTVHDAANEILKITNTWFGKKERLSVEYKDFSVDLRKHYLPDIERFQHLTKNIRSYCCSEKSQTFEENED